MRRESRWTKDDRRPYILITKEGDRIDLRKAHSERGKSQLARQASASKYRNTATEYNGKTYHSMAEAEYAGTLDQLKRAGEVREWTRQVKYPLKVGGTFIANYIADFHVTLADGTVEVHEVKGAMTEVARMKLALFEGCYPDILLKVIRV